MSAREYPALREALNNMPEEAIQDLLLLTGMFAQVPPTSTNEILFQNGKRSVGLALLNLKESDLNSTLISKHKELTKRWKTKQNLHR